MTEPEARNALVTHWLERAEDALASARREYELGDRLLAINRAYYACFYAATAYLLREKHEFTRHAAVRDAVHVHLIRPGLLDVDAGRAYDALFRERNQADYAAFVDFDHANVQERIQQATDFVADVKRLIEAGKP